MTKAEVRRSIKAFLEREGIKNQAINNTTMIKVAEDLGIYFYVPADCPEGIIEADVLFTADSMYLRGYYSASVSSAVADANENVKANIMQLVNYINAKLFFKGSYIPRMYRCPNAHDLVITTVVPYKYYVADIDAVHEYLVYFQREYLELLYVAIGGLLDETVTLQEAFLYIEKLKER